MRLSFSDEASNILVLETAVAQGCMEHQRPSPQAHMPLAVYDEVDDCVGRQASSPASQVLAYHD